MTYQAPLCRLFSHVDDPFLDDPLPREYVLYLRPSGPLQNQLSHFWQQSRLTCGKNKAHNIFPHITLCQFFMVSFFSGSLCSYLLFKIICTVVYALSILIGMLGQWINPDPFHNVCVGPLLGSLNFLLQYCLPKAFFYSLDIYHTVYCT